MNYFSGYFNFSTKQRNTKKSKIKEKREKNTKKKKEKNQGKR